MLLCLHPGALPSGWVGVQGCEAGVAKTWRGTNLSVEKMAESWTEPNTQHMLWERAKRPPPLWVLEIPALIPQQCLAWYLLLSSLGPARGVALDAELCGRRGSEGRLDFVARGTMQKGPCQILCV